MNRRQTFYALLIIAVIYLNCGSNAQGISSDNYSLVNYNLDANGGPDFSSANYRATISFGENILSVGGSPSYNLISGYISISDELVEKFTPLDLSAVYVYPNPYKPGSGGIYDAPYLTFKNLTNRATIRIFNIPLEHIATIEKDSAVNEYQWIPKNDAGRVISSGLYIYYISDPGGHVKKGKFTIIR